MMTKLRLSASVDAALVAEVEAAVARGRAPTVSAWVNDALSLKLEHDRRLMALADFVTAYEAQHGEISGEEMRAAARRARTRAVSVRGAAARTAPKSRRRDAK